MRHASPTGFFWNCLGCALVVGSLGVAISVAKTETLQLELARYKLKTGTALNKVQKASQQLSESTESLPIDRATKNELKQNIKNADRALIEAENQIEQEIHLLQPES